MIVIRLLMRSLLQPGIGLHPSPCVLHCAAGGEELWVFGGWGGWGGGWGGEEIIGVEVDADLIARQV